MMSYGISWKMTLTLNSMVWEWCLTENLSHLFQKNIYRKHHRVIGILVDALPHYEYIQVFDKSTTHTIFKYICATYEGNKQVREAKVNLLVQQYELFRMKED